MSLSSSRSSSQQSRRSNLSDDSEVEQIQLLTLQPKHHNPPPQRVVSNRKQSLTPDIIWSDPVPRCFLYSCLGILLLILIVTVHDYIIPDYMHVADHAQQHSSNSDNPHIIWFILDDLGQSDFSYHGAEFETPHIDAVASTAIEMVHHYVSPICSATRSSLLTGRFAWKMGLQGVLMDYVHPSTISHIPVKYDTIGHHLQRIGYDTRLYGKWHVGYSKASYTPTQRGFNTHIGYYQYAIDPFTKRNVDAWAEGHDWFVNGEYSVNEEYASDVLLDTILSDLDAYKQGDDPLFMYIALSNPHFPVVVPETFKEQQMSACSHIASELRQTYCLSVRYLDMAIGAVMSKLREKGLYDNSVVALAADNGPQLLNYCNTPGQHIAAGSAYPYRGGKYTLFQGGVQTPAFLTGGVIDEQYRGMKSNQVIHAVDWLPTLLHFTTFYDEGYELNVEDTDGVDLFDDILLHTMQSGTTKEASSSSSSMTMSEQRDYLILSMEYENEQYVRTGIIYKQHKLLINNELSFADGQSCDARSPKPDASDVSFESVPVRDVDGEDDPDMMLFDIAGDANEQVDILNGEGSKHAIFDDDSNEYKQLIVAMIKLLNYERLRKVPDIKTQSFEVSVAPDVNIPVDTHNIDGAHKPFQTEDEQEFPDGYHY